MEVEDNVTNHTNKGVNVHSHNNDHQTGCPMSCGRWKVETGNPQDHVTVMD